MLIEFKLEDLGKSDEFEIKLSISEILSCLFHDTLPMAILDSWMVELGDLRNGQVETSHSLLELDVWLDLVGIGQLLGAQVLDLFLVLHGDFLKNGWLELVPGQTGKLLTLFVEGRVDTVDQLIGLVHALHLDQLIELGNRQVEELLGQHMLVLLYVLGLDGVDRFCE